MSVATHRPRRTWVKDGMEVAGHIVEGALDGHGGRELLYGLRASDGSAATLVASASRHAHRVRFRRLARLRKDLDHPAAIRVRHFGEHHGQPFMITDAYPQRTFRDFLSTDAPLDPERLVEMLAPVVEALDLARGRGLVHQALDADSLLLEGDRLVLDSFGLLADADDADGGGPPTAWGNVYALTRLMVHALSPRPAEARGRILARELDMIVKWVMSKDPSEPPPSPVALLRVVSGMLGTRSVGASAPAPAASKPPRRRRAVAATAAALAISVGCGAVAGVVVDPYDGSGSEASAARPSAAVAFERLAERRAELRAELAAARTPDGQAEVIGRLVSAYEAAARAGVPERIAAATRRARAAYADLAAAAAAGDASAFAGARESVDQAERALTVLTAPNSQSVRK